jgi:hypothetical protein
VALTFLKGSPALRISPHRSLYISCWKKKGTQFFTHASSSCSSSSKYNGQVE